VFIITLSRPTKKVNHKKVHIIKLWEDFAIRLVHRSAVGAVKNIIVKVMNRDHFLNSSFFFKKNLKQHFFVNSVDITE
jgi:hypothetical protein